MRTLETLIIGAVGDYSQTRAMRFPRSARPQFTGQSVWRYNLCRPPGLDAEKAFYADCWGLEPVPSDDGTPQFMVKWAEMAEKRAGLAETLGGTLQ